MFHLAQGSKSHSSRKSSGSSRRPAGGEDSLDNKQYKPQDFAGSHISDVIMENERLKQQVWKIKGNRTPNQIEQVLCIISKL